MQFPVASMTTSSVDVSVLPNPSRAVRVMSTRSPWRRRPSPSKPPRRTFGGYRSRQPFASAPPVDQTAGVAGDMTTSDSRSRRNRVSRRGGRLLTRARSSSYAPAYPHPRASGASVPNNPSIRRNSINCSRASAPKLLYGYECHRGAEFKAAPGRAYAWPFPR